MTRREGLIRQRDLRVVRVRPKDKVKSKIDERKPEAVVRSAGKRRSEGQHPAHRQQSHVSLSSPLRDDDVSNVFRYLLETSDESR